MGLALGSLTVALEADAKQMEAGIAQSQRALKRMQTALTKTDSKAKKTGSSIGRAFRRAGSKVVATEQQVKRFGIALAAVGAAAVLAGKKYSRAFGEIRAITGASGQQLALIEQATKRYASTTTKSASEVLLLTKTIASLRPELLRDAKALDKITGSVITLSEAAGIGGVEAAEALGNTLNQFGLDAKDADTVINSLAAASQLSAKEIPFLTQALKEAGAVAKALNIPFDVTVAILEGLGKSGLDASKAGTGFRNFFSILQTEGIGNFDVQAKGAIGAIEGLIESNLSFSESSDLFGREVVVASEAIKQQLGHIKELLPAIQDTDTAYIQAAINADTFDGRLKNLGNRINLSAIALSQKLEPSIIFAGEAFANFLTAVGEEAPGIIDGLIAQLIKLGNVSVGVGEKLGATIRAGFGHHGSRLIGRGASVLGSAAGAFGFQSVSDDLFSFSGDIARNPNERLTEDALKVQLGQISLDTQAKNQLVDQIFSQRAIDRALGVQDTTPERKKDTKEIDKSFAGFDQQIQIKEQPRLFSDTVPRTTSDTDRIVAEMRLLRQAQERGISTINLKVEVDKDKIVRLVTKSDKFQTEFDKRTEDAARQIAR